MSTHMTNLQLAKKYCANMRPDGGCLGISVAGLAPGRCKVGAHPLERCVKADPKAPCGYFDRCVVGAAAMASRTPRNGRKGGGTKGMGK